MARRYYSSTAARTTLASGVDDTTTTFSVTAVSGWPASYPYTLIVDQDTVNEEIVEVSARSGTTLTVTRGVDGTSAVAHDSGAAVNHGVSGRDFNEPNAFLNDGTLPLVTAKGDILAGTADGTVDNLAAGTNGYVLRADSAEATGLEWYDLPTDLAKKVDYSTPVNAQTGTTYTFVADDGFRITTSSNASGVTFTIPAASAVAWPDNTVLRVVNYGAGAVTVDGGSGVTVTNTATTVAQYQAAAAIRTGSDAWTLVPFAGGGEIPAAEISSPAATGQYTDSGTTYDYYTFTASGTLTVDTAGFADILVVGGGSTGAYGDGGTRAGGGGGAGGVLAADSVYLPSGSLTVTIGAGGGGGGGTNKNGRSGQPSAVGNYISPGGGGGGAVRAGQDGGSGGGAAGSGPRPGGTGLALVGSDGGNSTADTSGGGGGGGSSAGSGGSGTTGGAGGAGKASSITGSSVTYGGGGGGGGSSTGGSGGSGGGGNGGSNGAGSAGSANTGGGGGGGAGSSALAGSGGSGIVIVRVAV